MFYRPQRTKPALYTIAFNLSSLLKCMKASGDATTYGLFWKLVFFLLHDLSLSRNTSIGNQKDT